MGKKHLIHAIVCMFVTGNAAAASAETLHQALVDAYFYNPTLLAERASLRATDEQLPQAKSGWLPEVDFLMTVGKVTTTSNLTTPRTQHREPISQVLTLRQNLYQGGQTVAATNKAENTILSQRAQLAAVETDILVQAATAYLDYYRDKEILELNKRNERILHDQLLSTRKRYEGGEITSTDVYQAEARYEQAVADLVQSESNAEISKSVYNSVIGHDPDDPILPKAIPDIPDTLDAALTEAEDFNFNVMAAKFESRASEFDTDEKRGALLPSLDLELSTSRNLQTSTKNSETREHSALLILDVPLYQAGSAYSQLRESRQTAAQSRHLVDKEKYTAKEEAKRAWISLNAARKRYTAFEAQAKAAETALSGVRREATFGTRTLLSVLDAEQEYLDAKVNLVNAERDRVVASYELLGAIGYPISDQLGISADSYDPNAHYDEVKNKAFGGRSSGDVTTMSE